MELNMQFLASTPLFAGTSPDETQAMLGCLGAEARTYDKGEYIYHMGDVVSSLGLVLSGSVRLENVDVWGNVSVLGEVQKGHVFAETYAAIGTEPLMVNVIAVQDCEVLFLNVNHILNTCSSACAHHVLVSQNLLQIFAQKNLNLSRRIFHAAPKSTRGKLLAYLSSQAELAGANEFDIPYNRQQLADYLGVDRSAMSTELSCMQKDGILVTKRNHFALLDI